MAQHLGKAVGDRRIDGARLIEPLFREIGLLGGEDRVAEDFGLLRLTVRAEDDFDDLLEIEQPKGKVQPVAGAEHEPLVAESGGVFAVRVDQHDMRVRVALDDGAKDRRDDARFARAGCPDDTEMLAEQLVREDIGRHRAVLMQGADPCRRNARPRIDLREVSRRGEVDRLVERRMGRDAAAERALIPVLLTQRFARQLELDDLQFLVGWRQIRERDPEAADHPVNRRDARLHLDQGAHFNGPVAVRGARWIASLEQRDGLRGRDCDDAADPHVTEGADIATVHKAVTPLCQSRVPGGGVSAVENNTARTHAIIARLGTSMRSRGTRSSAVVPTLSSLSRRSSPPCSSISALAMGRPRPVPSLRRVRWSSTCSNGSSTFSSCSRGMPTPVSLTVIKRSPCLSRLQSTMTRPLGCVNLTALDKRLSRTCLNFVWSTRITTSTRRCRQSIETSFLSASGLTVVTAE